MIDSIKSFLQFSPFKTGLTVIILSCLLFFSFGGKKPPLLRKLDNQIIDAMFHWRGQQPTTNSVVIVDIDEKSLSLMGQWPWPRNIVAELINNISAKGAKVIGLDIIFAESDRTSPKQSLHKLQTFLEGRLSSDEIIQLQEDPRLDHDIILGNTVAETPTVLGYVFQTTNDGLKNDQDIPFPSITIATSPSTFKFTELTIPPAYRAIVNVPDVATAITEGFFNVFPDPAGTVRKVPLFMSLDGIPYPSLALEMLRIGLNIEKVTIHAAQQPAHKQYPIIGVSFEDQFIPTDNIGQVTVNFRGPSKTFPYVSAADFLTNKNMVSLKDKYVLIGTSAAGILDLRATPFSSVFPGVEVHANLIDNLLSNDSFRYDIYTEIGLTYTVIILGGLLLSALLAFSSPLVGGLGGLLMINLLLFYGTYYLLFLNNQMIGITFPLITIFAIFLIVTLFNYFFKDREKKFVQGAFGHYVSPQVVKELIKTPEKLSLAGEEKTLTVFFNDIRGFTSISEGMNSKELGQFMNEYLTAMSNVIMQHKGTVDKYIGDAIMAIWGAPLDDEHHATNALKASLHMMEVLRDLQPKWSSRGLPDVDIGIGLNTGVVSVGNFGSANRFDYTVLGDNVNLASRLEGQNKTYGTNILIAESTKLEVGSKFLCRFVDMVKVKGKDKPVSIYEPLVEGKAPAELINEIDQFQEAIELYRKKQFLEARDIIEELNQQKPTKLYRLYLKRIAAFLETPPPDEWDGVFVATSK